MMHEHETFMTMNGLYCPVCKKFLKDIPKEEPKPKKKKKVTKDGK
jgi:hypothetical protein